MTAKGKRGLKSAPAPVAGADSQDAAPAENGAFGCVDLLGSSVLPAEVAINGNPVAMDVFVEGAFLRSGLDGDAWNALNTSDRDARLQAELDRLTAEVTVSAASDTSDGSEQPNDDHIEPGAAFGLAQAEADRLNAAVAESVATTGYPCDVTLRNNGTVAITDPVSGKYLDAGGSAVMQLSDAAHAAVVADNFRAMEQANLMPEGALAIEGLPAAQTD